MHLDRIPIQQPEGVNVLIGQSHFIKTVEDLVEILASAVPGAKFGLAFNEASGPCLVRTEGNDEPLRRAAIEAALALGAGHVFVLLLRDCYPVQVLDRVKQCLEVCTIFCATSNPVSVVVADDGQGRGVLGVIDGASPRGVEAADDASARHRLLRELGYKR